MTSGLSRRRFLGSSALAAASLALPRFASAASRDSLAGALLIDGLGGPGGRDDGEEDHLSPAEIADVAASGMAALHLTVGTVGTMAPLEAFEAIVRDIVSWEEEIAAHPEVLAPVRRAADIVEAHRAGRTGLVYGLQDGVAFEDDLERLDTLAHLGLRVVQPTYNRRNLLGDGCMEPADAGLSRSGEEAVARIQSLGLLLDLSHCGRRTAADAIRLATRPPAFTHTGCHALVEHPRHRTDEELRAVADKGGVSGIFVMPYLSEGRQPTAADVVAHIEHAVDVAGEDHVSVGTDGTVSPVELTDAYRNEFREMTRSRQELGIAAPYETEEGYLFAADLNTPDRFLTLGEHLLERGHTQTRVEKILGGNLLRVFGEAWGSA
ncbi:MAG: membrane dipeptidase [Thermoanaerobaculia bacterium]